MIREPSLAGRIGRCFVRFIDGLLIRHYRIYPFSDDPACILLCGPRSCDQALHLDDGFSLRKGDPLLGIHLWNERLASLEGGLQAFGLSRNLLTAFLASLRLLAAAIQVQAIPNSPRALRGEFGFTGHDESARGVFERMGWSMRVRDDPGLRFWRSAFWDNFYAWMLMWTYAPDSLTGKRLADLKRIEIWMSCEELIRRYGLGRSISA
jgi:hypothetical protein